MIPRYSLTYRGDIAECTKHVTFAQNLLLHAYKCNLGVLRRQVNDDTFVRVSVVKQGISRVHIETVAPGKMYMESGALNVGSYARCDPEQYRPGQLKFTDLMGNTSTPNALLGKAMTTDTPDYFVSEGLLEGDSLAVGCDAKTKVATVQLDGSCSEIAQDAKLDYTAPSNVYCYNEKIVSRKKVTAQIPPSLFTGKLKRYVSAVYGTKRSDYLGEESLSGGIVGVTIGGVNLLYKFPTSGIYTTTDYRYFLLDVGQVDLVSRELIPSASGAQWRQKLIAKKNDLTAGFIAKVESYILSTCVPDSNEYRGYITGSTIIGAPTAYGWHFTQDGHTATMVTKQEQYPANNELHMRQYGLALTTTNSFDPDTGKPVLVFTGTVSEVGGQQSWNPAGVWGYFYTPNWLGNVTAMYNPQPFTGDATLLSGSSAVLYSFYDDNDVLQVLSVDATSDGQVGIIHETQECQGPKSGRFWRDKYSYGRSAKNTSAFLMNGAPVVRGSSYTSDRVVYSGALFSGETGGDTIYGSQTDSTSTSDIPPFCYTPPSRYTNSGNWVYNGVGSYTPVDAYGLASGFNNCSCFTAPQYGVGKFAIVYGVFGRSDWERGNVREITRIAAIIPYQNASCVLFGKREVIADNGTGGSEMASGGSVSVQVHYAAGYVIGSGTQAIVVTQDYGTFPTLHGNGNPNYFTPGDGDTINEPPKLTAMIEFHKIDSAGPAVITEPYDANDELSMNYVFQIPIVIDPTGYFSPSARNSLLGSYKTSINGFVGVAEFDHPGTTVIGWA